jgi:hypothetical protein
MAAAARCCWVAGLLLALSVAIRFAVFIYSCYLFLLGFLWVNIFLPI